MSFVLSKNEIRQKVLYKRKNHSLHFLHELNEKIKINCNILLNTILKNKTNISIFIYLSVLEKGEVDTWNLINLLESKVNIKTIYVPKIIGNDIIPVKYSNCFYKNRYGIFESFINYDNREPIFLTDNKRENNIVNVDKIPDIVIIPLLAFNKKGDRIGFGGGYYDRYLKNNNNYKNMIKVGLCYENHNLDLWTVESHDIPLDYVVTATKIYEF